MSRKAHARPKVKELRKLYRQLQTTSIVVRVEVLKTVLQWYDQAFEYVRRGKKDLTAEEVRSEERLVKARRLGISSNEQTEKETAFYRAIEIAENICKKLHPYPVKKAFAEYEQYRVKVEARRARLQAKYGGVIETIDSILSPVSASGQKLLIVVDESDKGRSFSKSADEFIYNRATVKACQETLRRRGVLPLALQEIKPLSRAASMEDDGDGHFKGNPVKQVEAVFAMLDNVVKYCGQPDAPRRLIKVAPANGTQPRVVRTGQKGHFGSRVKVDGLFASGSKIAGLYTLLLDGSWHENAEMQKVFPGNTKAALKTICDRGPSVGWTVEVEPNRVRMVKEAKA